MSFQNLANFFLASDFFSTGTTFVLFINRGAVSPALFAGAGGLEGKYITDAMNRTIETAASPLNIGRTFDPSVTRRDVANPASVPRLTDSVTTAVDRVLWFNGNQTAEIKGGAPITIGPYIAKNLSFSFTR